MGRFSLDGYTDKCVRMLNDMVNPKYVKADKQIPATLLRHCEGVAFITIFKAGLFFLGGNVGGGCVLAKVKDESDPRGWRWSGPVSVTVGGLGGGFIFGGEKIDSLIIFNTKHSLKAFYGSGQVTFGGNLSLAAGPVGRDAEAHVGLSQNKKLVAAYSYSKAVGAYIGATLEGAVLLSRNEDNKKYYNDPSVTPERILRGEVTPPLKVDALHRELYAIHERRGDYAGLESSKHMSGQNISAPSSLASSASLGPQMAGSAPPGPASEEKLLPNWRKVFTADGKPYYHNTVTNETAWEAPLAPVSAPAPSGAPFSNAASTSSPFSSATSAASQAPKQPPMAIPVYGGQQQSTAAAAAAAAQARSASSRPVPPRPAAPAAESVFAMYDYTAARPDELSFRANDRLTVMDKSDPNWWKCSVNGQTGLAPSNYLKQ